jgi:outer membrane protein with beta-barrel domain
MIAILLAVPLALVPQPQQAAATRPPEPTFSYDYLEVGYITTDIELADEATDGLLLKASYGINEYVNFTASYGYERLEAAGVDTDFTAFSFGAGVHAPLHSRVDVYAEAAIISGKVESQGVSEKDTGYGLEAGFRILPVERIELDAAVVHIDVDGSSTNLGLGVRGYLNDTASIGFDAILDDDGNTYGVNLRLEL